MVGMLFNNILYCFSDIYIISYLLDFIIGNSITTTFLLYVCSYVFGFCKYCAKNVFDKYVRNINSSITIWDVYVAINAQYHDYVRLYSEWFRNINKNELDNKIIESAITFYFKDEDSGSTKTWNYFKTAN